MTVSGYIYDNQTSDILPGASVQVVDNMGNLTGDGVAADSNGYFTLTSPSLNQGAKLAVSNVGYTSALFDPNFTNAFQAIGLDQDTAVLTSATVTAKVPRKKSVAPYLLGGGALLLLATTGKKKRRAKVGDIGPEVTEILLVGGIAIGAYFLLIKPLLQKLGLSKTQEQQQTADAQAAALKQAQQQAQQQGKTAETYPIDSYTGWANDIFYLGTHDNSDTVTQVDQEAIVNDVANVRTMVDLQQLITAFGQRDVGGAFLSWCNLLGIACKTMDLPTFLQAALDQSHLTEINSYLSAQNINYTF